MVVALPPFINLLFAMTALAQPFLEDRLAPRGGSRGVSRPLHFTKRSKGFMRRADARDDGDDTEDDIYAAGAFLNGTYDQVTATTIVEEPKVPETGSGSYYYTAWVGVNAEGCGDGTVQTGLAYAVNSSMVSYFAWYTSSLGELVILNITINTGDQIRLTSRISGNATGTSVVENLTTGKNVVQLFNSTDPLCPTGAAWVLEEYMQTSSPSAPFADFGTVVFGNATASGGSSVVGPTDAVLYDIELNRKLATSITNVGGFINITYVWK